MTILSLHIRKLEVAQLQGFVYVQLNDVITGQDFPSLHTTIISFSIFAPMGEKQLPQLQTSHPI